MVAVAACSANNASTSCSITRSDVQDWLDRIPTKSGEVWYVVCEQWFTSFVSQFLDIAGDKFGPPRPTCKPGNSNLIGEDGKIRRDLIMDMDYRIVPKDCWERLVDYYDINRDDHKHEVTIIQDGDALGPELYKYEVTLQRDEMTNQHVEHFSRTTTFAKIEERMRDLFEIDPNKETHLRMQPMSDCQWVPIDDKSTSLLHSGASECPIIAIGVVGEGEPMTNGHGPFIGPLPYGESNGHFSEESSGQAMDVGGNSPQPNPVVDASSSSRALVPYAPISSAPGSAMSDSSTPKPVAEAYVGVPGVCGLTNMGYSCYLSSALQCLSNAKPLAEYFLSGDWKKEVNKENKLGLGGEMAEAFAELLEQLWSGQKRSLRPEAFKEVLDKKSNNQFRLFTQHDAHELLITVLDGLYEDLNLKQQQKANETVEVALEATSIDAPEKEEADAEAVNGNESGSSIVDLIYGSQKSTVKCFVCNNVSVTREPFQVLLLSLLDNNLVPVDFTLVSTVNPENAPVVRTVRVPANASVGQLLSQIAAVTRTSASSLWPARIQGHALKAVMQPDASLDSIYDIFVFEMPSENKENEVAPVVDDVDGDEAMDASVKEVPSVAPVVVEMVSGTGQHRTPFGFPVVFFPPPGCSDVRVSDLTEYVLSQCKRCLNNGWGLQNDAMVPSTDAEAEPEPFFELFESVDDNLQALSSDSVLSLVAGPPRKVVAVWSFRGRAHYTETELPHGPLFSEETEPQQLTLAECMQRFTREEDLDGDNAVFCSRCRQKQRSCKKIDLLKLPEVLIINLKRVTGSSKSSKVKIPVEFPEIDFDPSPWVKEAEQPVGLYDLVAVCNHTGDGAERGHYSTLAKNWRNGRWYKFDDDEVLEKSSAFDPKHAYILVYVKKESNESSPMIDQSYGDEHMEIA